RVVAARAKTMSPGVDRWASADLDLLEHGRARVTCALLSASLPVASVRVVGSRGSATAWFLSRPQTLGRLDVRTPAGRWRERVRGDGATFLYQLRAFVDAIADPSSWENVTSDAIANMRVIDDCYEAAGLARREPTR